MAKNLIPEIAKMLGVEIGEEFEIKGYKGLIYQFTDDELIVRSENETEAVYTANMTLVSLLRGTAEIVKLPWKPKVEEDYYTFCRCLGLWCVSQQRWTKHPFELGLLDKGWVFRTKEEAEAALPKVAAEMGVKYEI